MASNTCEDESICQKFQSAICMHCNRRLCFGHIAEHKKMLSHSITNFSYDVQTTLEQMKEESEKRRNIFNDILTSLNQWRTQQVETVQAIYDEHLKLINSQNEILNNSEKKLFEQLEQNALQPLEQAQKQRHTNMETINHIQQTINKLYEDNAYLKCNLAISPSPMDTPSPSISLTKTTIKKKILSNHDEKGRPLKRLVSKFGNISSIDQSKKDIILYIYKLGNQFQLPIIICSYLTAWYRKSGVQERSILLNEYITLIQQYLSKRKSSFDVLTGIQLFFHYQTVKEKQNEMMAFLLQFFLDHQCIDRHQIFDWYKNGNVHGYKGFYQAKMLATRFITSLSINQTINNVQTVSKNSMAIDLLK